MFLPVTGPEHIANQVTISIDDIPPPTGDDSSRPAHMIGLFCAAMKAWQNARNSFGNLLPSEEMHIPELHMTFNTERRSHLGNVHVAQTVDMLSFSNINHKSLKFIQHLANHTHVNYNHLVPSNVTSFNINEHVKRMTEIGEVVDSIYMVMFKTPVGGKRNKLVEIGDQQRMSSDITYINTMLDRLPKDVRRKVHVDGCLKDTIRHRQTGFGCSSNVSRVQVWPDGSVSGCPYSFSGSTGPGKTAEDILGNIRKARGQYDFDDRCHLPSVYDSLCR
jgi:hypothetical protein